MKKICSVTLGLAALLASCQTNGDQSAQAAAGGENQNQEVILCEFSATDSTTALALLPGKWVLRGIQTNYMGAQPDEFLTGEQLGEDKTLTFFGNGEYEEQVNGQRQGDRQPFNLVGQSLTPVGYQFWFCGENTLVINNIIADGATEVYVRQ
ncbi:hypothetical protein ACD591_12205 [Rufibacter glacialis]|uniref:Lipocalin-like domain-containing protein n=1 Tax=Rufibacter glacialis TaxID=1259555 RepID=A0A5M8QMG1_9BACT|nr:hypothetical protein [Rufibacter glacialis]KAA6437269.1 hypothetical protein FOE74_01865 [Rufibacter glacialis]GGK60546.1 hypothetical protein GCM10011405_05990 [Rufibacter glacialis]